MKSDKNDDAMERVRGGSIKLKRLFLILIVTQLLWGQVMAEETLNNTIMEPSISREAWETVARKTIFFGHQSVGNNIIDGLQMVAKENQFRALNIKKTRNDNDITGPMLAHSKVGRNKQPLAKIQDFVEIVRSGVGNNISIALMKLCPADINGNTNAKELFQQYDAALRSLQKEFPSVRFLAATCPLTVLRTGWKAWIKKIFFRSRSHWLANIKRYEFNASLRKAYIESGSLFDIAKVESTLPDGSRATYMYNDTQYYYLYQGYTYDGAHLSALGKLRVAEEFIRVLANIVQKQDK